jgi:hypothetical protein
MEVSDHGQGQTAFQKLKTLRSPLQLRPFGSQVRLENVTTQTKTRNVFRNTSGKLCSCWCQRAVATEVTMSARVTVLPTEIMETKVTMVSEIR